MMLRYSSAQDASSPESSDSGIQTDHNSTSHIDSLLPYQVTSSCHHSNSVSNNNADADNDDDNDTNNNNHNNSRQRHSHVTAEVKSCYAQGQGRVEGHCETQPTTAPPDGFTFPVHFDLSSFAQRLRKVSYFL